MLTATPKSLKMFNTFIPVIKLNKTIFVSIFFIFDVMSIL